MTTLYLFHEWIEASETGDTVLSLFGDWWDGDSGGGITGTGSLSTAATTASGSGTHTPPPITGSGTPAVPAATADGSGTAQPPAITGTATVTSPALTASGSGTHTPPPISGTGAPSTAAATAAASGEVTAPSFTGSGTPDTPAATASGSGTATPPEFSGSGTPAAPAATGSGSGLFALPISGTIAAEIAAATATATGTFTRLVASQTTGLEFRAPPAPLRFHAPRARLRFQAPLAKLRFRAPKMSNANLAQKSGTVKVGEIANCGAEFTGKLDAGELLGDSNSDPAVDDPTVYELNAAGVPITGGGGDLTIENVAINTEDEVIDRKTYGPGLAVMFTASGFVVANSPYYLEVTASTLEGQKRSFWVEIPVAAAPTK